MGEEQGEQLRPSRVIFTSPRRFHRGSRAYPANLVTALDALLAEAAASQRDWVHWLT